MYARIRWWRNKKRREAAGKGKEVEDGSHVSAAKQKRPLRCGAEQLLAERPLCCLVYCLYSTLLPQARAALELRWRTSRESHPSEVLSKLRTGVSL